MSITYLLRLRVRSVKVRLEDGLADSLETMFCSLAHQSDRREPFYESASKWKRAFMRIRADAVNQLPGLDWWSRLEEYHYKQMSFSSN